MPFYGRKSELNYLDEFAESKGSGFMYLRGRRRVGKSWILKEFNRKHPTSFYFMGAADASDRAMLTQFATQWDAFSKTLYLSQLRQNLLDWKRVFEEINKFALAHAEPLILIFDEIQWIAKTGSGFLSRLKEAWQDWEQSGRIKVIVCGSSNRFFREVSGSDEKILRGLVTHASLWIKPFSLTEIRQYYFPKWSLSEICLTYMMFGGIPYYLERLDQDLGFIHAVNEAVFTSKTIFLQEIDEILRLDFNKKGQETVKKILACLGQRGCTQNVIVQKSGLAPSTISEALEKLVDYDIVKSELPMHTKPIRHEGGYRYRMLDFYMNFYFQVLRPMANEISDNQAGLLFPYKAMASKKCFYIPNFSGEAFELLIYNILEERIQRKSPIFKKLKLYDANYEVGSYWNSATQIDIVIEHQKDRVVRIIECKWVDRVFSRQLKEWISQVRSKQYPAGANMTRWDFLVISGKLTSGLKSNAKRKGVKVIQLMDLFVDV